MQAASIAFTLETTGNQVVAQGFLCGNFRAIPPNVSLLQRYSVGPLNCHVHRVNQPSPDSSLAPPPTKGISSVIHGLMLQKKVVKEITAAECHCITP
eukprot:scaffold433_cov161-Skeletonema_marinoi.AAC.3